MENQNEIEFDLMRLLRYLLKWLWVIILATALFAGGAYTISKRTEVPTYTATCRAYVYDDSTNIPYNNALYSIYIAKDCQIMLTGRNVAKQVVDELQMNISPDTISGKLRVTAEEETHFLEISYTDTDPQRAAAILNKVCEVGEVEIKKYMNVEGFFVVYPADIPTVPSAGNTNRDTILGAAIGMVLSAAVLVILFLMDDTIRSEDDVERYLRLSTLSAVTLSADLASDDLPEGSANKKQKAPKTDRAKK